MKINSLVFVLLLTVSAMFVFSEDTSDEEPAITVSFYPSEIQLNPIFSYTSTEAQIYTALYEGLVTYHPGTLEPVPAVAQRWTISEDRKKYTFYLRENAFYWNETPVKAQHFRDTWLELLKPENEAAYSSLYDIIEGVLEYRTGVNNDPDSVGVKVLADNILEVTLVQPATHFLKVLCHHSFVPLHPRMLEVTNWDTLPSVISNGPYILESRTDEEMRFVKNELYWDAKNVKVNNLILQFNDDVDSVMNLFNSDEVHWVAEGMVLEQVRYPESIVVNPMFATSYYFFQTKEEPWNNPEIRRALALLLPWEDIRTTDYQFIPTKTLVPQIPRYPILQGINSKNEEEAYKLLLETGYPQGRGLPPIKIIIPETAETQRVTSLMAGTWKEKLNAEIEIETFDYPYYFDQVETASYTLGTITWIGDFADPLTFLQMWISTSNLNDSGYKNPDYDKLIERSMEESGEERYQTLAEAERVILESGLVLPMSHSPAINLVDTEIIEGWYPNPLDIHPFKYLRFADFRSRPGIVKNEKQPRDADSLLTAW